MAVAFVLVWFGTRALAQAPEANHKTTDGDELERLVDALANRNEPAKLVGDDFALFGGRCWGVYPGAIGPRGGLAG